MEAADEGVFAGGGGGGAIGEAESILEEGVEVGEIVDDEGADADVDE